MRPIRVVALCLLASCSKHPGPGPAAEPRVYVSDEDGGAVVVLSATTDAVIARVPVGKRPRGLRVSPDGTQLYVALSGTPKGGPNVKDSDLPPADPKADGIGVVDLAALKLLRVIPGGADPESFDVTSDGKRLWVSNEDAGEASLIDIEAGEVLRHVSVGKEPEGVTIHPGGKVVYVTNEADNSVSVLDVQTGEKIDQIATGGRPRSVVFTADGGRAYITCENTHVVIIVDGHTHQRIGAVDFDDDKVRPMGLAIAPDGHTLYVTGGRGKTVHAVSLDGEPKVARKIADVGARPWGIGITHGGDRLYTANGPAGDVSVIDVATGTVTKHIPVGGAPWGIAVR